MYDGDFDDYYDNDPSREERDKARRRGCAVAALYVAILVALLWYALR